MVKNDNNLIEKIYSQKNFSFSKNSTYRCGGMARIAYYPKSFRQAVAVYDYLIQSKIKFIVLGNGSNILASDNFYDGAVISLKLLNGIYRKNENTIFCRAGTTIAALLKYCIENGLGGLEYLAGIPATCGGLVFMNGGAGGTYICENVVSVTFYDGKMHRYSNTNCHFSNKYSTMRDINSVILGAELNVVSDNSKNIKEKIDIYLDKRKRQPKGASCGCVFKNPIGESAGMLIDKAGLKGLAVGSAFVSSEHANFIINTGNSSSDVKSLIQEVKRRVFESTGIVLEEEVVYIGD